MCARRSLSRPPAAALLFSAVMVSAQPAVAQDCAGLTTGSVILSEHVALVFMAAFAGQRAYLDVAFLARGEAGWNSHETTFQPWLRPKLPDSTGYLTGVGIGRLFLQYDQKAGNAWVHTQKVAVRRGDVLVVDNGHTHAPEVRAVVRVDPAIPLPDACRVRASDNHVALRTAILDLLLREPQLRDIMKD